ncbi:MAG: hypothetical protein ICV69_11895 [Thermoleophilaceae bacterium]|nr:hypothetical protein [Thermoleophilaceae bacterium]
MNGGLPMGQTHHWAALVFVAASRPFPAAEWPAATGVALDLLGPRRTTVLGQHVASFIHLPAGLAFRFAWTQVGEASARDNEAVAQIARGR